MCEYMKIILANSAIRNFLWCEYEKVRLILYLLRDFMLIWLRVMWNMLILKFCFCELSAVCQNLKYF